MLVGRKLLSKAEEAVGAFFPGHNILGLDELGDGHINDTFLVVLEEGLSCKYVLQRLNRQVFADPEVVMSNLRVLVDHIDRRLVDDRQDDFAGWEVVRPIKMMDGSDYFIDLDGNFWRMLSYVDGAASFDIIKSGEHAREAGRALGLFHRLVWDLEPKLLADTLPDFHVTPKYLDGYDRLLEKPVRSIGSVDEEYCAQIIEERRSFAPVLENAICDGVLPVRVIHGDPKLANIMFNEKTSRAVSLVDLDTVKPGLLHYDIGDCLRSCCNLAGDDGGCLDDVRFDTEICGELLGGYLAEMAPLLTEADYEFIYPSVKLITFELGLRFFTDHLAGDIYFKVSHNHHNLQRALGQFKLMESIEDSEVLICGIVEKNRQDIRVSS